MDVSPPGYKVEVKIKRGENLSEFHHLQSKNTYTIADALAFEITYQGNFRGLIEFQKNKN